MAKKYDLTTEEFLEYLHQFEDWECNFKAPFTGFPEDAVCAVEEKYQIKFPPFYKKYLLQYGQHPINDVHDHICPPDEIVSNYDCLLEDIDDYANELEKMSEEDAEAACEEEEIYQICRLPQEEWHTIVPEYILTWYENQGVWNAGYLRSDLEQGVADPPMYISTNDDFITFQKAADNTETFLKSIFFMAGWCLDSAISFEDKESAVRALEEDGIDLSLAEKPGVNLCLDTDTNILYTCMVSNSYVQLVVLNKEFDEDEE